MPVVSISLCKPTDETLLAQMEWKDNRLIGVTSTAFNSVLMRIEQEIRIGKFEGRFVDEDTFLPFRWSVSEPGMPPFSGG